MNRMSSLHVDAKVNEKCVCVCLMKKLIEYTSSCAVTEEKNIRDNIVETKYHLNILAGIQIKWTQIRIRVLCFQRLVYTEYRMRKCSSRYRTYRLLLFSHAYWSRVYMQHLINKRKISNNGMKSIHVLFCLDSKLIR